MDSTVNVELNLHDLESVVGSVINKLTMDPQWAAKVWKVSVSKSRISGLNTHQGIGSRGHKKYSWSLPHSVINPTSVRA